MVKKRIPHTLIILDGWGMGKPTKRNAIFSAHPKNFNLYWDRYPHTKLLSWGTAVGLPKNDMGNSEVGHMTIGSGQITEQHALHISNEITKGSFVKNPNLTRIVENFNGETIHMGGLLSNAHVHSSRDHLVSLFEYFSQKHSVVLHLFTDGRDSSTTKSQFFINNLPEHMKNGVATVSGRYYAMDRDHNWDRTQKTYDVISKGIGERYDTVDSAIDHNYKNARTDEFIIPCAIGNYEGMSPNDLFFVFNFREDRIRQITTVMANPLFTAFDRDTTFKTAALTEFEDKTLSSIPFLYPKIRVGHTLSDKLAQKKLTQLHVAESEKYAHVTYFFNGGREEKLVGEEHIIIPSPHVETYDIKPEMSAPKVADTVINNLEKYDFIVVNFANPDMVAHTGNMNATVKAIAATDEQLGRIVKKSQALGGHVYITSDHGNAEVMQHKDNKDIDTKHNRNKSPFIYIGPSDPTGIKKMQGLSDIAQFILQRIDKMHTTS